MELKPIPSVGWFISDEDDIEIVNEFADGLGQYVHASFYEWHDLFTWWEYLMPVCHKINSIHLPNNLTLKDYKVGGIVPKLQDRLGVNMFTVHPWADDLNDILVEVLNQNYSLCLENFPCKSKKSQNGNLFNLLARFGRYMLMSDRVGLTLDLSHMDDEIANYTVVKSVLPYTRIIHMSCRVGKVQHLPIFRQHSDVNARNLVGQVLNINPLPVHEIVLEYDKQYRKDLVKHIFWLKDLIQAKRRRFQNE
jgi:hypothetical protein